MKYYLLLVCIFLSQIFVNAQNNQTDVLTSVPEKKGLIILGLTNNRLVESKLLDEIKIPQNYFRVEISKNVIKPLDINVLGNAESDIFSENELNILLNNNNIGQQILSFWFARQENATFNLDSIRENQLLDYQEIYLFTEPAKKGHFPENTGIQKIVNSTYIILVDFMNIQSMDEYYNQGGIENENRNLSGYILDFNYYLLKFDFNNSVASHFFNNCWITEDTEQSLAKKLQFVGSDFPFIFIDSKSDQVAATQHIQVDKLQADSAQILYDRLLGQLIDLTLEKAVFTMESENIFYKNNHVQKIKPISAGIGEPEDVKFDRKYFVYQNQVNILGKVEKEKIGVVKSMKIADNRLVDNNERDLSEFYQTAGKKIANTGMYLERGKDLGINICLERSLFGPINTSGRIEYYISKVFDGVIQPGKNAKALSSLKVFFEAGYNDETHTIEENLRIFDFFRGAIGLSKDFYPSRNLFWSPFAGFGMESATWDGSKKSISTKFIESGLLMGINVVHNIQITGTLKNNSILNSKLLDENKEVIDENFNYIQTFSNRKGVSFALGFRIMI